MKDRKLTINNAVVCVRCGDIDTNRKGHIGTHKAMFCPDCGESPGGVYPSKHAARVTGYAQRCRDCCPTGHGTRAEATP